MVPIASLQDDGGGFRLGGSALRHAQGPYHHPQFEAKGSMTVSGGVLREFFLLGDGFALDELALDGFFLFFEGCALDGATHHIGFALEACALRGGIEDACGVVGCHALEGIGFLSVSRVH